MPAFDFALELKGDLFAQLSTIDRLLGAGCDDATFAVLNGVPIASFTRDAATLGEAIGTAIDDIGKSDTGITVIGVAIPNIPVEHTPEDARRRFVASVCAHVANTIAH